MAVRVRVADTDVFEELRRAHYDALLAYCRHLCGSHCDGDDLAQMTLLRAYQDLERNPLEGRFQSDVKARRWIKRIAYTAFIDTQRALARRPQEVPLEEDAIPVVDGPGDAVETAGAVARTLGHLVPRQRRVLVLRDEAGLSYRQVATEMGISENAARQVHLRARMEFRRRWERLGGSLVGVPLLARLRSLARRFARAGRRGHAWATLRGGRLNNGGALDALLSGGNAVVLGVVAALAVGVVGPGAAVARSTSAYTASGIKGSTPAPETAPGRSNAGSPAMSRAASQGAAADHAARSTTGAPSSAGGLAGLIPRPMSARAGEQRGEKMPIFVNTPLAGAAFDPAQVDPGVAPYVPPVHVSACKPVSCDAFYPHGS